MKHTKRAIAPIARREFNRIADAQFEKGIRKYGTRLMTWNGRSPTQDAKEELVDALQYVQQAEEEMQDMRAEIALMRAAITQLNKDVADLHLALVEIERDGWVVSDRATIQQLCGRVELAYRLPHPGWRQTHDGTSDDGDPDAAGPARGTGDLDAP